MTIRAYKWESFILYFLVFETTRTNLVNPLLSPSSLMVTLKFVSESYFETTSSKNAAEKKDCNGKGNASNHALNVQFSVVVER